MNWIAKLEKTKKELEETINLEKRKLMMEREMIVFQRASLEKKIEEIADLEEELSQLSKEKEKIKKLEEAKISKERFLADIKNRISKMQTSNREIQQREKEEDVKIALLDNPEPYCPICHKEMRYDQKVNIKNTLLGRASHEKEIVRRNSEQSEVLLRKKELNEEELKEIDRKLMAKPLVFEKVPILEEKIAEIRKEARKIADLEKRERDIKKILAERSYASMSQKLLKEINKEIKKNL